ARAGSRGSVGRRPLRHDATAASPAVQADCPAAPVHPVLPGCGLSPARATAGDREPAPIDLRRRAVAAEPGLRADTAARAGARDHAADRPLGAPRQRRGLPLRLGVGGPRRQPLSRRIAVRDLTVVPATTFALESTSRMA